MLIREAIIEDIPQIQVVRNLVKENILSDPNLITDNDCEVFITQRGKGWVCIINEKIVGFSIIDLKDNNVWALFINPDFEKKGIGKKLHNIMLDWYFEQTTTNLWLSTTPKTRAEIFYRKLGWIEIAIHSNNEIKNDEIKFEMTYQKWKLNIKI